MLPGHSRFALLLIGFSMKFLLIRSWLPALLLALQLQSVRAATPADSARVPGLLAEGAQLVGRDSAKARRLMREAVALSQGSGYRFGEGAAWNALAVLSSSYGDTLRSARYLARARQVFGQLYRVRPSKQVGLQLAIITNNQARELYMKGRVEAAGRIMLEALRYVRAINDVRFQINFYSNLGYLFMTLNQPDKAASYWLEGWALRERGRQAVELATISSNLSQYYDAIGQTQKALEFVQHTKDLVEHGPPQAAWDEYYTAQGKFYINHGEPAKGVAMLAQAIQLRQQAGDLDVVSTLRLERARGLQQLEQYTQARAELLESLRLMRQVGQVNLSRPLAALVEVEEKLGHPAQALAYERRRAALQDSINSVAVRNQINSLETQFRTRQQAERIALLQQRQHLQADELRRQRTLSIVSLALAATLLGAGGLGFIALRNRRKVEQQQQQLQARKIQELEQERQLLATEAMLRGQEEERSRLARDLHDGLGGMLSSVKYYLGSVRGAVVLPEASAQLFSRSLDQLDSSISELRRVARDMMPEALLQFGLVPALRDVCDTLRHSQQLEVNYQTFGLEERLPQRTEVVVYRLVQELLNNVLKHAQARHVIVQLSRNGRQVQVTVEDDGVGFDPAAARSGVGLRSIQARVDYLRGALDLHTAPNQGTTITIDFTLPEKGSQAPTTDLT